MQQTEMKNSIRKNSKEDKFKPKKGRLTNIFYCDALYQ